MSDHKMSPSIVLAEAEILDEQNHTLTQLQSSFSIEDPSIWNASPYRLVRAFYAAAAYSVHQAVQGAWETVSIQNTIQDVDYQAIEDRYKQLSLAVSELGSLDEDDNHYIDEETEVAGQKMIQWLDFTSVPPPKIFSHGGDSIVFTWEIGDTKRYLTPIDGIARVRDYSNRDGGTLISAQNFDLRDNGQTVKLTKLVGGTKWKVMR